MVVADKMVEKRLKVLRMQHIRMRAQNKGSPKAGSRGSPRSGSPRSGRRETRAAAPKRGRRKYSVAVSSLLSFPSSLSIDPSLYFMYEQEAKREYPDIPPSIKRAVIKEFLLSQATHYRNVVLARWRSGKTRFQSYGSDMQKQMLEDAKSFLKLKDDDEDPKARRNSAMAVHEKLMGRPKFNRKLDGTSIKRCVEICYERLGKMRASKAKASSSSPSTSSGKKTPMLGGMRRSVTAGATIKGSLARGRRRSMSAEKKGLGRRASAALVAKHSNAPSPRGAGLSVVTEG